MSHLTTYNRNIFGGKRCNKGITKYGGYKTLSERLIAEIAARETYEERARGKISSNKSKQVENQKRLLLQQKTNL